MRKYGILLIVALATALLLGGCGGNVSTAKGVVSSLAKGDFTGPTEHFDSTMKAKATPEMLKQYWTLLTGAYGALKTQGDVRTEKKEEAGQKYEMIIIPCEFERGTIDATLVFNDKKEIAGLFFMPKTPPRPGK